MKYDHEFILVVLEESRQVLRIQAEKDLVEEKDRLEECLEGRPIFSVCINERIRLLFNSINEYSLIMNNTSK